METFSSFFKVTVADYFKNLPLPSSLRGIADNSGKMFKRKINRKYVKIYFIFKVKDWVRLIPFYASLGLVSYVTYKEVNDYLNRRELQWVNKSYGKDKAKIADIISKSELDEIIDKNNKVAYCRCWKSKKFPYCDGSHAKVLV
jgi:CDGSH iron-sulfur domain-containing protein 2